MKVKHLVGAFLCVLGCYACSSPKTEVQSPDGHIKMTLTVDENGKPVEIPRLNLDSDLKRCRFEAAEHRKQMRLETVQHSSCSIFKDK